MRGDIRLIEHFQFLTVLSVSVGFLFQFHLTAIALVIRSIHTFILQIRQDRVEVEGEARR